MENITEKLALIIREQLPEAVGKELQEVLKKGEEYKLQVSKLEAQNNALQTEINANKELLKELLFLKSKKIQLEADTEAVRKRENQFEVEILKTKLLLTEQKCQEIHNLADTVFRNPKLTYSSNWSKDAVDEHGCIRTLSGSSSSTSEDQK